MAETVIDAPQALAALHADLSAAEGPIVEPSGRPGTVLVTFVCISAAKTITLLSSLEPSAWAGRTSMARVPGTDVWHVTLEVDARVCTTYQFNSDPYSMDDWDRAKTIDDKWTAAWNRRIFLGSFADPHNPRRMYPIPGIQGGDPGGDAPTEKWASVLTLPDAEAFPYLDAPPRQGRLERHSFSGQILPGQRDLSVYLPPGYTTAQTYPLVVIFDGEMDLDIAGLDGILDAAVTQDRIPPLIVCFWHNRTVASRVTELNCTPELLRHLADELLPWIRERYPITDDSSARVVAGFSLGGLSAAWIGLERPDAFGAVLAMSPSLWWAPPQVADEPPEPPGWLTRRYGYRGGAIPNTYVTVGSLEGALRNFGAGIFSMTGVAREFADLLQKNCSLAGYHEEPGAHDFANVQRSFVRGLTALLARNQQTDPGFGGE